MSNEWIEWKGGKCPVQEGTMVDIRYRDGVEKMNIPALKLNPGRDATISFWRNDGYKNDIIAYRLNQTESQAESQAAKDDGWIACVELMPEETESMGGDDFSPDVLTLNEHGERWVCCTHWGNWICTKRGK